MESYMFIWTNIYSNILIQNELKYNVTLGGHCHLGGYYVRITSELLQGVYSTLSNDWFPTKGPVVNNFEHNRWSVYLIFRKKLKRERDC